MSKPLKRTHLYEFHKQMAKMTEFAGLGFVVKLKKDTFIGKDALTKQKAQQYADHIKGLEK